MLPMFRAVLLPLRLSRIGHRRAAEARERVQGTLWRSPQGFCLWRGMELHFFRESCNWSRRGDRSVRYLMCASPPHPRRGPHAV